MRNRGKQATIALCMILMGGGCAIFPDVAPHCGPLVADPAPRGDTTHLPHGIRLIDCEAALCWAVPLDDTLPPTAPLLGQKVVLIDTGIDARGERLLAALAGAKVVQVWVTHGHIDHWAAAHLFHDDEGAPVPVYVHEADIPYMKLKRSHRSLMAQLGQRLLPLPPLPENLRGVRDRASLEANATTQARVVHLPGHTPGSSAFLFRDVLFGGDSLVAPQLGGVCAVPGFLVTDDENQAWRSLRKLRDVPFEVLLDGNYGRTDGAQHLVQPAVMRWRRTVGAR